MSTIVMKIITAKATELYIVTMFCDNDYGSVLVRFGSVTVRYLTPLEA